MKRSFQFLAILAIILIIPQFAYASPVIQRCEPSAAVLSGNKAVYETEPGEIVRHTWTFENNGYCDWPRGVQLVFVGGERFSGPHAFDLDQLAPGQTANVVADLQAPSSAGEYLGEWQLRVKDQVLSEKLLVNFVVIAPQIALPASDPVRDNGSIIQEPGPRDPGNYSLVEPLFIAELPTIEVFTTPWIELAPGETESVDVACEDGVVVGAQWSQFSYLWEPNFEDAARIYTSHGLGNSWRFSFRNPSEDVTNFIYAGVRCLRNVEGSTFNVSVPIYLTEGGIAQETALCPGDSVVVGGGFDIGADTGIQLRVSDMDEDENGWKVNMHNASIDDVAALAFATCLIDEDATSSRAYSGWESIDEELPGAATATCPEDTLTANGGFGHTGFGHGGFIFYYSRPYATGGGNGWDWSIRMWNPTSIDLNMFASATCLSFP